MTYMPWIERNALLYFIVIGTTAALLAEFLVLKHINLGWYQYQHRHLETDPTSVNFAKIVGHETKERLEFGWRLLWNIVIGGMMMPGTAIVGLLVGRDGWLKPRRQSLEREREARASVKRKVKQEDIEMRERELAVMAAESNLADHLATGVPLSPSTEIVLRRGYESGWNT